VCEPFIFRTVCTPEKLHFSFSLASDEATNADTLRAASDTSGFNRSFVRYVFTEVASRPNIVFSLLSRCESSFGLHDLVIMKLCWPNLDNPRPLAHSGINCAEDNAAGKSGPLVAARLCHHASISKCRWALVS
jgi:hypothetical protein